MKLKDLKYLVALTHEKHFGKAAKRCAISQPTLSVAIQKLEQQYGQPLFERLGQQIRITSFGQAVAEKAQRVIDEMEVLEQWTHDETKTKLGTLAIGAIYTLGQYFFPKVLPRIHAQLPGLSLTVIEGYTEQLLPQLIQGHVDMVLLATPLQRRGLVQRQLTEERLVWVLPADHPIAEYNNIDPNQLGEMPLLMLDEKHCLRSQIVSLFDATDFDKITTQTIGTSVETIKQMVASGYGVSILPEMAIDNYGLGHMLKTCAIGQESARRKLYATWRVSYPRPDLIEHLLQAAQQAL